MKVLAKTEWDEAQEAKREFQRAEREYDAASKRWKETHTEMVKSEQRWLLAERKALVSERTKKHPDPATPLAQPEHDVFPELLEALATPQKLRPRGRK